MLYTVKLQKTPKKLAKLVDTCVTEALAVLGGGADRGYSRPAAQTDVLYRMDGQVVSHPAVVVGSARANRIELPIINFGAVATGQLLSTGKLLYSLRF